MPDIKTTNEDSHDQADGPLILVIDDGRTDCEIIRRQLLQLGYRVQVAPDGEQGLQQIKDATPSAIIVDLELPGMTGGQVLETLNADADLRAIPVFVSSQHAEAREQMIRKGVSAFLAKPVDRDELKRTLGNHPALRISDPQAVA